MNKVERLAEFPKNCLVAQFLGKGYDDAVHNAVVMEEVAKMTFRSLLLNPETKMDQALLDKHFLRKHGPNAYYGQKKK